MQNSCYPQLINNMTVVKSNNINNTSRNILCYMVKQLIVLNNKAHCLEVDILLQMYPIG